MSAEPFLAPGPDAPKPAGDPEDTWFLDEKWESSAYFGSLMTAAGEGEELTAQDISGSGFGQDGTADQLRPGPVLATLVHAATSNQQVLASLPDDDLIGIIRAARKMESLIAWAQLTAIREFATRPGSKTAARRTSAAPCPDPAVREFAADELTGPLTMTWQGAAGEIGYARTVAGRLPVCFAALATGRMHPGQLRIIAEESAFLSDADVAIADEMLAGLAPGKTPGQLRSTARRLVLRLDPDSARRRREAARSHAQVRKFAERSGNAGMVAHELPADEAPTWLTPATPPAPLPAAVSPLPAATWTTPTPGGMAETTKICLASTSYLDRSALSIFRACSPSAGIQCPRASPVAGISIHPLGGAVKCSRWPEVPYTIMPS
jgi:hypothetical protein